MVEEAPPFLHADSELAGVSPARFEKGKCMDTKTGAVEHTQTRDETCRSLLLQRTCCCSPSATSLRTAPAHSSKSHSHGGVIFCFPQFNLVLRFVVVPSAWPAQLFWSSSAIATLPLLIPIVPFLDGSRAQSLGLSCETPAASGPPGLHTTD